MDRDYRYEVQSFDDHADDGFSGWEAESWSHDLMRADDWAREHAKAFGVPVRVMGVVAQYGPEVGK